MRLWRGAAGRLGIAGGFADEAWKIDLTTTAIRAAERDMERAVFVYTTYPSIVEAERAGRSLVERRLCACVNILPGMVSLYRWEGAIERGDEVVMIIKPRAGLAEAVRAAVKEMHSYTAPAILVI